MGGMSSRMTCDDVVKCMKEHEEKKKQGASAMGSTSPVSNPAPAPAPDTAKTPVPGTAVGGGSKKSKKSKKKKHNKSNKKQKKKSIKKNKNKKNKKSGQKRK